MATRNIVPQNANEGGLGVHYRWWGKAYIKDIESTALISSTINTDTIETKHMISNGVEIDFYFLKRNTVYKVDDIAYTKNLKNGMRLECVQGGTTSNLEPIYYTTVDVGSYVTDGTTKWIVCDIRDGLPYGDISYRPILKKGYVKLNGATVQRADYPRLVKYATDNNLWTDSPTTDIWKFGNGDGSTTFVLPDYRNVFIEGGDTPAKIGAGLPNINGRFYAIGWEKASSEASGAFYTTDRWQNVAGPWGEAMGGRLFNFNASMSNAIYGNSITVQPPSIVLIPQIKY